MTSAHQQILNTLAGKSSNKQAIYENTLRHFESIKGILRGMAHAWSDEMQKRDPRVEIEYKDKNKFECSLKFSGDTLGLVMHTNIFTLIRNTLYTKVNASKKTACGLILDKFSFTISSLTASNTTECRTEANCWLESLWTGKVIFL